MKPLLLILIISAIVALTMFIEPMNGESDTIEPNMENCIKLAKEACKVPVLNAENSFYSQHTYCDKIYPRNHQLLGSYEQCTNNVMTPLKCGSGDRETCPIGERVAEICSADVFNKCMSTIPRKLKDKYITRWGTHCN